MFTWLQKYKDKVSPVEQALSIIESGMRVYIHPGTATPKVLVDHLVDIRHQVENVEIIHSCPGDGRAFPA